MKPSKIIYSIRRKLQIIMYYVFTKEFLSKLYFRYVLKYHLDLDNPQSLNEKIQWLKLYYWPKNEKAIQCADKFKVRDYIQSIGYGKILNDLLYVWDDPKEIIWDNLPNEFVIKCNHGCGYNVICDNKAKLDSSRTLKQINKWFHEDFSKFNVEPHYSKIDRKIICEKYLDGEINNYNIYVFNGKAIFFSLAGGLGNQTDEHLTYYYPNGKEADFKNRSFPSKVVSLSSLLPQMIDIAETIGKDFPMVRVDLFDYHGSIILSELTFTPGGGLIPFSPSKADFSLGSLLDIEKLVKN